MPAVLRRGSRSEIHLVLDCVYVFIFQPKLKRRKKDNTSWAQRNLIWGSPEHCGVENLLKQKKVLYGIKVLIQSSAPRPQRLRHGLELVTTGKGWAWVREANGLLGLQSAGGHH